MKQYILPADWNGNDEIILTGKDHHYLTRVRRYPRGTSFPGRDRKGNLYTLTLVSADSGSCTLRAVPVRQEKTENPTEVILYPCLLKGKNTDLIIRQATEAGVSRIQPIITQNSVRKGETGGEDDHRLDRWKKIAREAAQQCGNPGIPEILPPLTLNDVDLNETASPEGRCGLFFHEKTLENKPLHEYLREIPAQVSLFFGPEGGFSPEEVRTFIQSGLNPVYLGDNVLRAETAVLYGTGAVQTILRERDSWEMKE